MRDKNIPTCFENLINAKQLCRFLQLFFIQACQGDKLDGGISMRRDATETDSNSPISFSIPVHADFLISYSTIPGTFSF